MYIIEVIPISRAIGIDTLSYFTSKKISVGAIVDIPLRKKTIQGIVISSSTAESMKSEIKSAEFALKKIDKIKANNFFSKSFIDAISEVSNYYATSIGSVLDSIVPDYIIKNTLKLKNTYSDSSDGSKIKNEKYVIQGDDEERYTTWKSLIRQEFAKKKSVLFILPTIEECERTFELLEKGVHGYTFILHGSLPIKKIIDTWNMIVSLPHPVVIIATGGFLSISRADIETIVIERENNRTYKLPRRPFVDIRYIAEIYAEKRGLKLFLADNFLRIETLYRKNEGEMIEASPFKFRSLSTANDLLIDMKSIKDFKIISDELIDLIRKNKDASENMIILATRRGLSPSTVCGDCQNIVLCNSCNTPVVLHKNNEKSFFMCHRCGERRSAEEYCKTCGSWKLNTLGIGIDTVIEKIKDKFPDIILFKIDSDSISKSVKNSGRNVISKFKAKPGSILVGTEMMLQYLHDRVENGAIVSLDSLFALPDFRIQERILYNLIRIRALTTKKFIVQTRKIDEKVFEYGLKGNMSDFYKNTIDDRKKFNYPPFSTLIKFTLEGKKEQIVKEMDEAQNILDPFEIEIFPAFTNTVRGKYVLHGVIRILDGKWPNSDLILKIRQLSPRIIVKVDPETLL
ncbi:MAG: hypothetical protein AAB683_01860 [Patescibacteria group bacterium]